MTGTVKRFVNERGFGFVTGQDGREFFFHCTDLADLTSRPAEGDTVEFEEVVPVPEKGPRAKAVRAA